MVKKSVLLLCKRWTESMLPYLKRVKVDLRFSMSLNQFLVGGLSCLPV